MVTRDQLRQFITKVGERGSKRLANEATDLLTQWDDVPKVLRITIGFDPGASNPLEDNDGSWTLHTFGNDGFYTYRNREEFFDEDGNPHDQELAAKLVNGLAFGVEHLDGSYSIYRLSDTTEGGLLVWGHAEDEIGAKTVEDRRKDAAACLEEYTDWGNGRCYFVTVERIKSVSPDFDPADASFNGAFWETEEEVGGFIGDDNTKAEVNSMVAGYDDYKKVFVGEHAGIMD